LTGASRRDAGSPGVRTVSGVYYFYRQPKAFDGGELRLYAFGEEAFVDIEPSENAFVAFPSFAAHEVLPVTCPSGAFEDSRFSVNCWLHCEVG
jgi:Rps23 Pro-64 3,4-dihydroxylase Tpa1-like proline 4-hydroxylase